MMNRRTLMAGGAALAVAGGAFVLLRPEQETGLLPSVEVSEDASTGTDTDITEMVLGDPEARLEVIEYASYTCPHCASFHANQFEQLKTNYIDTGLIRFVYREVYFDRPGLWASMIARCGGEQRFFGITDILYEKQADWARAGDPNSIVAQLKQIGRTAGMTDEVLDACMQDADNAQTLVTWYEENRSADSVESTPSFIIGGEKFSNMAYAEFAAIIDRKLAEMDS